MTNLLTLKLLKFTLVLPFYIVFNSIDYIFKYMYT